ARVSSCATILRCSRAGSPPPPRQTICALAQISRCGEARSSNCSPACWRISMVYWLQDAVRWIWRWFKRLGALTLLAFLVFGLSVLWRLQIDRPETFADPVAQFKYGSTGGDKNFGIPYSMWQAIPVLFKDLLPKGREDEGWAALGFLFEGKEALPPEM